MLSSLQNKDGSYDLPIRDLLYSKYPSTIIDVQKRDVKQSSSVGDHPHLSQTAALEELSDLYSDRTHQSRYLLGVNPSPEIVNLCFPCAGQGLLFFLLVAAAF